MLTFILVKGAIVSLVIAIFFLFAAIVGWRGPGRNRRLVRFAIFLVAFPVLLVAQQAIQWSIFLPSLDREAERQRQSRVDSVSFAHVGDIAPSLRLDDTSGNEFVLDALRGKVVLVNFFSTSCGACYKELPLIQNRDDDDFEIIVIGREETNASVTAFQTKYGYTFPMASDPDRTLYSLFAKELIPRTYLVSRTGRVCFASIWSDKKDTETLEGELSKQLSPTQ
jgi:peroxiredoxin